MGLTNHPAQGPVSLDRLQQISEILSKAAAQSDGGNLGYAMADAVKVIDEVLEARNSEPVGAPDAWLWVKSTGYITAGINRPMYEPQHSAAIPLYAVPPAPPASVVPEELLSAMEEVLRISDRDNDAWHRAREGISACRAAMLQASNSPVTPDTWIPVSERMPEDAQWCAVNTEYGYYVQCWSECQGWLGDEISLPSCDVTHWVPLPAAPQQGVK